jgi:hypothetical protein
MQGTPAPKILRQCQIEKKRLPTCHYILRFARVTVNGVEKGIIDQNVHLLDPMLVMADAGGPMKITPAAFNFSANTAFSLRNP